MSAPKVTVVTEASPAARAGLAAGDELVSLNGQRPRDVIEYQQLVDGDRLDLVVRRPGEPGTRSVRVVKATGEPLGVSVASAVFDRVRTCDNHCAFCFIHQLPKGMRRSLYLKDDDYRLSFLYGNFTTLTRFTELDAERVLDERLGPLFVSIHATDPDVRARLLRNPRGATSLRWLRVLLDGGIEVHGQIVVCPGVNDGPVLEDTFLGVLDRFPELATVGVVPLGVSRFSSEPEMRPHTVAEAAAVCDAVERWQATYHQVLGRRLAYAADEYYLLARRAFPPVGTYDGFPQHENGIGMARAFEQDFSAAGTPGTAGRLGTAGHPDGAGAAHGVRAGFFAWVEGAPAAGYRAPRLPATAPAGGGGDGAGEPPATGPGTPPGGAAPEVAVVTGRYGAQVLAPLLAGRPGVRVVTVANRYFGGNIGVAGLLTGDDLRRALAAEPPGTRYLLPDACLSQGRFLDGLTPDDLPRPVEVVASDGASLRAALDGPWPPAVPGAPVTLGPARRTAGAGAS